MQNRFLFRSHHLLSSAEKTQVSTVSCSCLTCSSNSARRTEAGGMRRPQLGLPRLLGMRVGPRPLLLRRTRIGDWNDGRASDCMKQAPEGVRGLDQFLDVCGNQAMAVRNFLIVIFSFALNVRSAPHSVSAPA